MKLYWKCEGDKDRERGGDKDTYFISEFCSRPLSGLKNWYSAELSTQAVGLEPSRKPSYTPSRRTPPTSTTTAHRFPIPSFFSHSNSSSAIIHTVTLPLSLSSHVSDSFLPNICCFVDRSFWPPFLSCSPSVWSLWCPLIPPVICHLFGFQQAGLN